MTGEHLQEERHQFCMTAAEVINILCRTDPPATRGGGGQEVMSPRSDYLGTPSEAKLPLEPHAGHIRGYSDKEGTGWGNWFGSIACVCKAWNAITQVRRRNPLHFTIDDWHHDLNLWEYYEGQTIREILTFHASYSTLHSIYLGAGAIQNISQVHRLINLLCDHVPTRKNYVCLTPRPKSDQWGKQTYYRPAKD